MEITTDSLPSGRVSDAYTDTIRATGGPGSYEWSIAADSLPPGLAIAADAGTISGMPTEEGTYSFVVQAATAVDTAAQQLQIVIAPDLKVIDSVLVKGHVGIPYADTLRAIGADGPVTWVVTSGALPDGISLVDSTGALTGVPAAADTATFRARVRTAGDSADASFSLVIGTLDSLAIVVQPSASFVDSVISPPVEVVALDDEGDLAQLFTGDVEVILSPGTGTTGAMLGGTTIVSAIGGRAVFDDLAIDSAGTAYTLQVTDASGLGMAGSVSQPFDVTRPPATQLAFVKQPTSAEAGQVIGPSITLEVRDAAGLVVTDYAEDISISIASGTGDPDASLGGTTTAGPTNGVAAFDDLSIVRASRRYVLTASASGLSSAISDTFDVNPGPPAVLAKVSGDAQAGATGEILPDSLTIQVQDTLGNGIWDQPVSWSVTSGGGSV
ncbi:MAG: putative Ig domain-containing protein, partial [Acidimicrobiia bacterium]|nr:putative Ig domain-containing protein [Acidimicrobiia bacterium]